MILDLNDMGVFAKVIDHQGFSAASREIGLPKSNISRRVSRLEEQLGVRLLERTPRQLHLTEIGEIYYQHCKRILQEMECAESTVQQLVEIPRGRLKVNASVASGQHLLSPLVGEYMKQYPEVQVQLYLTNRRVDLIEEGMDIGIRVGVLKDSSYLAKRLGVAHFKLYASRQYLQEHGTPEKPIDLQKHDFLAMEDIESPAQLQLSNGKESQNVKIEPRACINDFGSIHSLLLQNLGIAMLPTYFCRGSGIHEKLTCVLPEWSFPPVDFHALYPSVRGTTPKVRTFLDFLAEKFSELLA